MKKILLIIISAFVLLTGCQSDTPPDECVAQANEFVGYFKEKDFESMYAMTKYKDPYLAGTYDENSIIGQKLFDAMSDHLTFEITGGSRNGSDAYVNAHITTIDFKDLLTNVVSEYTQYCKLNAENASSEELSSALESILDEALQNPTPFEKDTSIDFVKEKGKWIIEDNVGIYDDLSGGYINYCFGLNAGVGQ